MSGCPQVETTVNFCKNNRLIGWYLGGLNVDRTSPFPNYATSIIRRFPELLKESAGLWRALYLPP
jgi:hypothetical protein